MSPELTVEEALNQLREMFPDGVDYEIKFGNWLVPVQVLLWREMTSHTFSAETLSECMAQVRAWKEPQKDVKK